MQRQLALPSEEFEEFLATLSDLGIKGSLKEYSLIRLFYILKDHDFSNNFHQQFAKDFSDQLIEQYARMWNLNSNFKGMKTERVYLKTFYKEIVLAAINLYANRNAGYASGTTVCYFFSFSELVNSGANGNNSSIRLLGQAGSLVSAFLSHLAGSRLLSWAVPNKV